MRGNNKTTQPTIYPPLPSRERTKARVTARQSHHPSRGYCLEASMTDPGDLAWMDMDGGNATFDWCCFVAFFDVAVEIRD